MFTPVYLFIHRYLHSERKLPEGMSHYASMTLQALGNRLHECSVQGFICLTHLYLQGKWNPQLNSSLPFYLPAVFYQLRLLYSHFSVLQGFPVLVVWFSVWPMPLAVLCEYECYVQVSQLSPRVFGHILLISLFFFLWQGPQKPLPAQPKMVACTKRSFHQNVVSMGKVSEICTGRINRWSGFFHL